MSNLEREPFSQEPRPEELLDPEGLDHVLSNLFSAPGGPRKSARVSNSQVSVCISKRWWGGYGIDVVNRTIDHPDHTADAIAHRLAVRDGTVKDIDDSMRLTPAVAPFLFETVSQAVRELQLAVAEGNQSYPSHPAREAVEDGRQRDSVAYWD